jgi:hypothetical protein
MNDAIRCLDEFPQCSELGGRIDYPPGIPIGIVEVG